VLFHHWVDQIRAKDRFLDELFTQPDPDGHYLRQMTKDHYPELWEDLREQLIAKGVQFKEPAESRWDGQPVDFNLLFQRKS
jgi:extradiol dioxygenase family protein